MASIRQRSGTWQARVIREGFPAEVKSFATRSEAQKWARHIESAMDGGGYRSGTKVEIVVRSEFEFPRGNVLDNLLRGHEVDTKFSLSGDWMIPREAIGELCLLVCADDNRGVFSAGVARMAEHVLRPGKNQDGKRSVSAAGRAHISWLVKDGPMPANFLLRLDETRREALLSPKSGKQRILALFRNVTGQVIPRSAIVHVAQLKGDPLRRAREAKETLSHEGLRVLCAAYQNERAEFVARGFTDPADDDWLVVPS